VSAVDLKPVYLITGSDRPKVELAVERLRRHFADESTERVSAAETTAADVVALCNMGSLFGDRRLVLVTDLDGRRKDEGRLAGGWRAAEVDSIVSYLHAPAPGTVLALVAEETKKGAPLAKAVARAGDVLEFNVVKKQLSHWVADRFKDRGVRAEPDACTTLIQLVGDDLLALSAEIDKVATWAAGEAVGGREIEQLVAPSADTPVFAVTDAWGRRETGKLLEAAEAYLERSGRPHSVSIPILAGALARHVGVVRRARRLEEEGVRPQDATKRLGVRFEFQARRAYECARNFGDRDLDHALLRLAQLDHALKGGSRLSPEVELQRALVDAARPSTHVP
jgi:DNA polymerase-3 subunit delta